MILKSLLIALFISLSIEGHAQDAKAYQVSIGTGLLIKKNLRVGNRYEDMGKSYLIRPIPVVIASVGRFSLGPQGLSFMALGNRGMSASVFINRGGDRYQGFEMAPRKDSVFVGTALKFMKYGLNISKDINGRSKGIITSLSYGDFFGLSESFVLRGGLSLDWHDDRYAEYYYGVRKTEANATRREYHLTNYFQPGISVSPIYKFDEKLSFFLGLNMKLLPKKISDSPTMNGDKVELGTILAVSYAL